MAEALSMERLAALARCQLEDPAFRAVYEKLYLEAINIFRNSKPEQHEVREIAYWRIQALEDLSRELEALLKAPRLTERMTRSTQ